MSTPSESNKNDDGFDAFYAWISKTWLSPKDGN
jgi:hypothetical protein